MWRRLNDSFDHQQSASGKALGRSINAFVFLFFWRFRLPLAPLHRFRLGVSFPFLKSNFTSWNRTCGRDDKRSLCGRLMTRPRPWVVPRTVPATNEPQVSLSDLGGAQV